MRPLTASGGDSLGTAPAVPSLDRSTKKPTAHDMAAIEAELHAIAEEAREARALESAPVWDESLDEHVAGRWVRLTCENWRAISTDKDTGALFTPLNPDKAPRRAVVITKTKRKQAPPRHVGDRWTDGLSRAAQVKIENAARYTDRMGRGFRTFATLSLDSAAREQLRAWDFADPTDPARRSLGALVADFIKTLKQAWARGQILRAPITSDVGPQIPVEVGRLRQHKGPLVFAWVAECPENSNGEPNPHVHFMFNWGVAKKHFRAWAAWIERAWGHGFANLTRLKKPSGAAAYMAKAARYIGKGGDGSQGMIRGNRYGIATDARAPAARVIGTYFADFLHEATKLLSEAKGKAREKLRAAGVWASRYAFGCKAAGAWRRIWGKLKRDGFTFDPAPPDLQSVQFHNWQIWKAQQRRIERDLWLAEQRALSDENWNSLLQHSEGTAWVH